MRWYFERHHGDHAGYDDDDSAPGLAGLPTAMLQRHGALVLYPADAAAVPGWPAPRSTVYRARTLLVPGDLLDGPVIGAINRALAQVGLSLIHAAQHGGGKHPRLPRTAVLKPVAVNDGRAAVPVVVDAWVALQMLRAAATARQDPALTEAVVRRISLEHLLMGSAITGSPISEGGGVTGSPISEGGGVTGPGAADSYLYAGGDARTPVEVSLDAPTRLSAADCISRYGRRPVVAVLDTGVRTHPWLGVRGDPAAPGGYGTINEAFVAVDQGLQSVIHAQGQQAGTAGDQPSQLIEYPWDTPITADPLINELETHTGHGTFIAGILRQVVPDAEVLAVRVMHSDGAVYENNLTCALSLIADRVAAALQGDMAQMVDVVSLSLGYFSESVADIAYSSGLLHVIHELTAMGVPVIAAAGNYSTSRKFFPAAFAELPVPAGHAPVISVGALNPNGSKALFSDGGAWIRAWATGAAIISTFPTDVNGGRDPEISVHAHPANTIPPGLDLPAKRQALDRDNYKGGFAAWSGTSFAAPQVAGCIAKSLLEGAAANQALRLDQSGGTAAARRMASGLQRLGWS